MSVPSRSRNIAWFISLIVNSARRKGNGIFAARFFKVRLELLARLAQHWRNLAHLTQNKTHMNRGRLGILVGGGPAPGLNGVIAAATIEGINQGYEVIGFRDGFKHLAAGDTTQIKPLAIRDVRDIHLKGG